MKKELINRYEVDYKYNFIAKKALKKKLAKKFDEKFYNSFGDVYYNNISLANLLKNNYTIGNCHFYATILAYALKNSTLKKGFLNALNVNVNDAYYVKFEHSWVEIGNYCVDTTSKQIYNKEYYYKYFEPEVLKQYTNKELHNDNLFMYVLLNAMENRSNLSCIYINLFNDKFLKSNDAQFKEKINNFLDDNLDVKNSLMCELNKNKNNILEK